MRQHLGYVASIARGHLTGRRIPIYVILCVTDKCNLKCLYCYRESMEFGKKELTTAEMLDLVDELARRGTKYISLNGGEALLRPDLAEIHARIKERGLLSHLSTNGLLVPRHLDLVSRVDSVAISLDGDRVANDRNRGEGTYERILEVFRLLRSKGIAFHVHTVLTKNNPGALEEIMALAADYRFQAQFSILRGEDSPTGGLQFSDEEMRAMLGRILEARRKGLPVFFSEESYRQAIAWPLPYETERIAGPLPAGFHPVPCRLKQFSCHIESDGRVFPCVLLVNKFPALSVREDGFGAAWDRLAENPCTACYNVCCTDMNLIFDLRPAAFWNAVKIVLRRERSGP